MLQRKKILLTLFFVSFFLFLFSFQNTNAQSGVELLTPGGGLSTYAAHKVGEFVYNITLDGIQLIVKGLLYVVSSIASIMFWLGGQLIEMILYWSYKIPTLDIVKTGWGITRDIANLGFVLAIIIIAVATIVRWNDYGAKKTLVRLIAAAVLVNFSLTIGAVFIDFSNVLTDFFIKKSSSNGVFGLSTEIADAFSVQKLTKVNDSKTAGDKLENTGAQIAGLFFAAIFTFMGALTLLGMALMLLIRIIYLAVLLVMAPLAWLFWVIPDLTSEFKKWWNNFLKWCFYAPILSFFIYLTITSIQQMSNISKEFGESQVGAIGVNNTKLTEAVATKDFFEVMANMIIIIGFLVAGLMTAQSMGMAGAKGMMKIAENTGNATKKWAGKKTAGAGRAMGRKALTAGTDEEGKTALERLAASKAGRIPLVGRALTRLSRASSNAKATSGKSVEEESKKFENITGEDAVTMLNKQKVMGDAKLSALGLHAMKKGTWDKINDSDKDSILAAMRKTNSGEKATEYAPHLAGEFVKPADKAKAEAKAAAKLTDIPKNVGVDGKDFADFIQRNITNLPNQLLEKVGTMTGVAGENARNAVADALINQTNSIKITVDGLPQAGYAGVKFAKEKIDEKTDFIESLDSDITFLRAQMGKEISQATTRQQKDAVRQGYASQIYDLTEKRQKATDEKRSIKDSVDSAIKSISRETSVALDSIEKISKNPNYKEQIPQK